MEWNGLPASERPPSRALVDYSVRSQTSSLIPPFTLSIHHRWYPRDRPYDTELRGVDVFKTALLLVKEGTDTTVTLDSNQVAFSLSFSFPIIIC
jgi:hypothetical protein